MGAGMMARWLWGVKHPPVVRMIYFPPDSPYRPATATLYEASWRTEVEGVCSAVSYAVDFRVGPDGGRSAQMRPERVSTVTMYGLVGRYDCGAAPFGFFTASSIDDVLPAMERLRETAEHLPKRVACRGAYWSARCPEATAVLKALGQEDIRRIDAAPCGKTRCYTILADRWGKTLRVTLRPDEVELSEEPQARPMS